MRVLVLGDAPTARGSMADGEDVGDCPSARKVRKWVDARNGPGFRVQVRNAFPYAMSNKLAAYNLRMEQQLNKYDKVIALGRKAEHIAGMAGLRARAVYAPHPSGLNRNLNGTTWEAEMLKVVEEL